MRASSRAITAAARITAPIWFSPLCTSVRFRSTDASTQSGETTPALSPRWLSDVKQRIGKCMTFGLRSNQVKQAGDILEEVARDWRELLAGSEGYLTGYKRRGLFRHKVVWGDSDSMGHVNNVLYNRYAESGRVQWAQNYARYINPENADAWNGLVTPTETGLILRKIITEFKFPMKYPDHITVYHKLGIEPKPDTDAFHFDVLILSELHQRPAARLVEDCVLYDYKQGKKTTFKPFMLDVLRETWRLQEQAKDVYSRRVQSLLDRVRTLEIESWDREDAVEDMGSSNR